MEKHPNKYKPDGATDGMDEQGGERESLFLSFALFQPVRSVYKFYLTLFRTRGLAGRALTVPLRFRRSRRDGGLVLTPISSSHVWCQMMNSWLACPVCLPSPWQLVCHRGVGGDPICTSGSKHIPFQMLSPFGTCLHTRNSLLSSFPPAIRTRQGICCAPVRPMQNYVLATFYPEVTFYNPKSSFFLHHAQGRYVTSTCVTDGDGF